MPATGSRWSGSRSVNAMRRSTRRSAGWARCVPSAAFLARAGHHPLAQVLQRDVEDQSLGPLDQERRIGRREIEDQVEAHPRAFLTFLHQVVFAVLAALPRRLLRVP